MNVRPYIGEENLHIDGRMIPYPIVTAADYLQAKHSMTEDEADAFIAKNGDQYRMLNTILAMKQSCVLLRHTAFSCQSLTDDLNQHKCEMVQEYNKTYEEPFDETFYEAYCTRLSKKVEHLSEVDMSDMMVPIAVIFNDPLDFPGKFTIRLFDTNMPTNIVVVKDTLEECREECLYSCFQTPIPRSDGDDPHIVECWLM